jgi:hypothetical protein
MLHVWFCLYLFLNYIFKINEYINTLLGFVNECEEWQISIKIEMAIMWKCSMEHT